MTWIKVAESCSTGPCPTIYIDPETGAVRVQGDSVMPHVEIPTREGMLEFPPAVWQNLIEQYLAQSAG